MLITNMKLVFSKSLSFKRYAIFSKLFLKKSQLLFCLKSYQKYSFIFVISMLDLVGFDVYMSNIMMMKFSTLTTSSVQTITLMKLCPATILFSMICSIRLTNFQQGASWFTWLIEKRQGSLSNLVFHL